MLHAIIMAGGSGTRFWPKSRRDRPKQLLSLYGDATMLQQTVDRIEPLVPRRAHRDRHRRRPGRGNARAASRVCPPSNIVAEPCPRDTAPCVGLAAWIVAQERPRTASMIVMPADHVIEPVETFLNTVRAAVSVIEEDPTTLVTFGIKPTRPETGYGYIERGELLETRDGIPVNRVVQFREKPDRATAEQFLAAGNFAWNSGMFLWRARTILDELKRHRPALAAALARVGRCPRNARRGRDVIAREYPRMERAADRQGRDGEGRQRPRARGPLRLERRGRLAIPGRRCFRTTPTATRSRAMSSPRTRPARSSSPTTAA